MNKRTFLLDQRAAARIGRMLSSTPTSPQPSRGEAPSGVAMAMITAHEGSGVYQAVEVFWNGSAWASNNCSRTWGAYYSTPGLRHVDADTSFAYGTIVRAFLFNSDTVPPDAWWWFKEGGASAYTGPFAVSFHATDADKVTIGALRGTHRKDLCYVIPTLIYLNTAEHLTITDYGWVYVDITREGVPAISAPQFRVAPFFPTMASGTVIPWPLAYVSFSGGIVTGIYQHQYGDIITYQTTSCTCTPA